MMKNPASAVLSLLILLIRPALHHAACPEGTVNYRNQSCYIFIGQKHTADMARVLQLEPKCYDPYTPKNDSICDMSRGGRGAEEDLRPCVWSRKHALEICLRIHELEDYVHLAKYADAWHLPVLELREEDDWFNDQLVQRQDQVGTRVWIDLVKEYDDHVWSHTQLSATWFHRPMGVDPWWPRCNVQMTRSDASEVLCYEYHIDYMATKRKPFHFMRVRGWHPRACFKAYEQESDLDHLDDFDVKKIRNEESWLGFIGSEFASDDNKCYHKDWCAIPQDKKAYKKKYGYIMNMWAKEWKDCGDETIWLRGSHRMRLAPVGVACEADIGDF